MKNLPQKIPTRYWIGLSTIAAVFVSSSLVHADPLNSRERVNQRERERDPRTPPPVWGYHPPVAPQPVPPPVSPAPGGASQFVPAARGTPGAIDQPLFRGPGCPDGTTDVTYSADKSSISVLFSNLIATTKPNLGFITDKTYCAVVLPVYPPAGYRLKNYSAWYRGFYAVPSQSKATFRAWYKLYNPNGDRAPIGSMYEYPIVGSDALNSPEQINNYVVTVPEHILQNRDTACGQPVALYLLLQVEVSSTYAQRSAVTLSLDSQDSDIAPPTIDITPAPPSGLPTSNRGRTNGGSRFKLLPPQLHGSAELEPCQAPPSGFGRGVGAAPIHSSFPLPGDSDFPPLPPELSR